MFQEFFSHAYPWLLFNLSSVEDCQDTLTNFGVQDITPASVARVLGKYPS